MKLWIPVLLAALTLGFTRAASADVGWSEEQYTQTYGRGQRGFAKANERAYNVGSTVLVVEFSPDNSHSTGELWALGVVRDNLPEKVRRAGEAAEQGTQVQEVVFGAKSALPAVIREATVDDQVVRVDLRNNMVTRIAFCGPKPTCGWWQRIFGPACQTQATCAILERALSVDRTMDDLHKRAEKAVEGLSVH
jgi:hypothetical protein